MRVTIIADASHCPMTNAAGYGYWIASDRGKEGGGGSMKGPVANSIAAEMFSICIALHIAFKSGLAQPEDLILVQCDCTAAIRILGLKQQANSQNEKEAVSYFYKFCEEQSIGVQFRHVKGHTQRKEARFAANVSCDKHARQGMRQARTKLKETTDATETPVLTS